MVVGIECKWGIKENNVPMIYTGSGLNLSVLVIALMLLEARH
jgi:hypothetical protein